jgi:hypothetical protein
MTEPDQLQAGLRALESDLLYVPLTGPEAARRRGRQRTRRHVAGIAGGLAIVATTGLLGPLDSFSRTGGDPSPVSPATRVERTPATPTPPATPAVTEDVLLDAADLVPQDGGWRATDTPWAGQGPFACAQGSSERADEAMLASFAPVDEGRLDQVVEWYHSTGDAEARFDEVRAVVADCASQLDAAIDGRPEFWKLAGVGDAAWVAGYWTSETAGEARRRVEIGVVRTGNAVTHVTWGFLAQDSVEPVVPDATVAAAEKLCVAAGGTCVSDPVLEPDAGASEKAQ